MTRVGGLRITPGAYPAMSARSAQPVAGRNGEAIAGNALFAKPARRSRCCTAWYAMAMLSLWAMQASGFEIEHSGARYIERQYHCELIAVLDAPVERIEAVLRDYEHYPQLDARILQAHVLERPAVDTVILQTLLRACFGPFCHNVLRVERVQESPRSLVAITDPARSDVKFGESRVRLSALGESRTRVHYRTSIVPDFWIPPLIGRRWMLNTLKRTASELFEAVEARARLEPSPAVG